MVTKVILYGCKVFILEEKRRVPSLLKGHRVGVCEENWIEVLIGKMSVL